MTHGAGQAPLVGYRQSSEPPSLLHSVSVAADFVPVRREVVEVEAKESRGIAAQNFRCIFRAEPFPDLLDRLAAVREGAFVVGVVIAPDQAITAGQLDVVERNRVIGDGDRALALEVLAGS